MEHPNGYYKKGTDPEVTCWHCKKTFLCDCMDATCRLCGAPHDKKRCKEFNFIPKNTAIAKEKVKEVIERELKSIKAHPYNPEDAYKREKIQALQFVLGMIERTTTTGLEGILNDDKYDQQAERAGCIDLKLSNKNKAQALTDYLWGKEKK